LGICQDHASALPEYFTVHPSVPAASVKELIALGKSKPLNFASAATVLPASGVELFRLQAGMNLTHILHKGGGWRWPN
jgi:tripartite-type tricarboxylate transporter receptor subunit TctC